MLTALLSVLALPRTAHLGVSTIHSPPRSLVAHAMAAARTFCGVMF